MTGDARALRASVSLAWAAVEASGVPDHVQESAFRLVLRSQLLSGASAANRVPDVPRDVAAPQTDQCDADPAAGLNEAAALERVASETGVPIARLEEVVHIDEGVVKLVGPHTRLGTTTADKARMVAQIVTVIRRVGLQESDTSFEILKSACESKHCYDSKNFATDHLPKIAGFIVKGEKRNRRLEARGAGVAAFPALIDRVLGA